MQRALSLCEMMHFDCLSECVDEKRVHEQADCEGDGAVDSTGDTVFFFKINNTEKCKKKFNFNISFKEKKGI